MRHESVQQVVARIRGAAGVLPPPAIVATDADGTIWSGDVGVDAFESMLERKLIRAQALAALQAEARDAGLPVADEANEVARVLYEACERGTYAEVRAYEMMAWVFAGWAPQEIRDFMREVIAERRLVPRLHGEVRAVFDQVCGDALPLFVVSASPTIVVEQSVAAAGLKVRGVIAAEAAIEAGIVQPRMASPIPYAAGKVVALQSAVPGASVAAAFGDNLFDLEMLRLASVPVAVRPKPRLAERAGDIPRMVELVAP